MSNELGIGVLMAPKLNAIHLSRDVTGPVKMLYEEK